MRSKEPAPAAEERAVDEDLANKNNRSPESKPAPAPAGALAAVLASAAAAPAPAAKEVVDVVKKPAPK